MPLMAVDCSSGVRVDRHFKEPQLQRMRVGQPVSSSPTSTARRVGFTARSAGLAPGTGAPSRPAGPECDGNWIKIVQRVPVASHSVARGAGHPLQIGLSMKADGTLSHGRRGAPSATRQYLGGLVERTVRLVACAVRTRIACKAIIAGQPSAPAHGWPRTPRPIYCPARRADGLAHGAGAERLQH